MVIYRRRGFTIVELLVVVAIIGGLMALLLPAVQAARESGRRTACMSNLYQIGIAANRNDQDSGHVVGWKESVAGGGIASWPVVLLPYLERTDAYDGWLASPIADVSLAVYRCPSAPTALVSALAYAGNCGNQANAATDPPNRFDGVMIDNTGATKYSLSDIADGDGTSTTLLLAEKCGTAGQWLWRGAYAAFPASGAFAASSPPAFGIDGTKVSHSNYCEPSSQHTKGRVVAFCDGRTHFLSSNIDLSVYAQLVTSRNSRASATAKTDWGTAAYVLSSGDY